MTVKGLLDALAPEAQDGFRPLEGRLVPLKTKDEIRAALTTFDVYVLEVSAKHAGAVKE